jgi:hypothetical protein
MDGLLQNPKKASFTFAFEDELILPSVPGMAWVTRVGDEQSFM